MNDFNLQPIIINDNLNEKEATNDNNMDDENSKFNLALNKLCSNSENIVQNVMVCSVTTFVSMLCFVLLFVLFICFLYLF